MDTSATKAEFVKALVAAFKVYTSTLKHCTQLNPNLACTSKPPAKKFRSVQRQITRVAIFHAFVTLQTIANVNLP